MKAKNGYIKLGVTVFFTVAAILLFYDTLFGRRTMLGLGGTLMAALKPILLGALLAYLLAPMVDFFEEKLFPKQVAAAHAARHAPGRGIRSVSMLLTWVVISALGYVLFSVLLPELYRSILQLINNVENYYHTVTGWVQHLLDTNPDLERWATVQMDIYYKDITTWLTGKVLPQAQTLMSLLSGGVVSFLVLLKNLLVGIIASVYLLATKERCAATARKMAHGLFSRKNVGWVLRGVRKVDVIFSGFVRGKLLDSLIIGILCFICCSLFQFPYTPLVSVIVGVTNVIPFFGPFLGAIPSLFLILLVSPIKALYFLLFILALQQVDGNIIGPKILGDKTGLSSLWVIIAILVGGSFFGIPGMFFGVPVCACLYSAVLFFVETRLRRRELPVALDDYFSAPKKAAPISAETDPLPPEDQEPPTP